MVLMETSEGERRRSRAGVVQRVAAVLRADLAVILLIFVLLALGLWGMYQVVT